MADTIPMRDMIAAQMKDAMKTGQRVRVGRTTRAVVAALKEREIEARRRRQDRQPGR